MFTGGVQGGLQQALEEGLSSSRDIPYGRVKPIIFSAYIILGLQATLIRCSQQHLTLLSNPRENGHL
jgi:hypothetical protein